MWDLKASGDSRYSVWRQFKLFFSGFLCFKIKQSPSTSVVQEKAATLFYCEAPGMFRWVWNFTWLDPETVLNRQTCSWSCSLLSDVETSSSVFRCVWDAKKKKKSFDTSETSSLCAPLPFNEQTRFGLMMLLELLNIVKRSIPQIHRVITTLIFQLAI